MPQPSVRFQRHSAAIAVLVLDARHFAALRGVQPAVAPVEAKRLVQPRAKSFTFGVSSALPSGLLTV